MDSTQSTKAQNLEEKYNLSGRDKHTTTVIDGKIYLGDGRYTSLTSSDLLVDTSSYDAEKLNEASKMYTDKFLTMYDTYEKIHETSEKSGMSPQQIAGAAGPQSVSNYDTVRSVAPLIGDVVGQQRILEEYNAVMIADQVPVSNTRGEYVKKTSSLLTVQKEIGYEQIPDPVRQAFIIGEKEIFADGVSWVSRFNDKDHKLDIAGEFQKELPGMFAQAKEDKVIALVNAITGTNQGNWKATSGNFYSVDAAEQIQVAEDAVGGYGGEKAMLINSDAYRGYLNNIGSAFDGKLGNSSLADASQRSGMLMKNPSVKYFINDNLTAGSYVLAKVKNFMKYLQGMTIQSSFKETRTAGASEQKFWFDFNGFEVTEDSAAYRGTTVLA